jgi:hypothetical protein
MDLTYESRGKIAFVEDQAAMAAEAFRQSDFEGAIAILRTIHGFLGTLLAEEQGKPL